MAIKGIILWHTGTLSDCWDFFVSKHNRETNEFAETLYHVSCEHAQKFLETDEGKKMKFLGSEDNAHSYSNLVLLEQFRKICSEVKEIRV